MGIFFTSLSSHCTRLNISSSEISSSEYLDELVVLWYWKPNVSRACSGWILLFIQSNMTASPVTLFCLRSAIRASSRLVVDLFLKVVDWFLIPFWPLYRRAYNNCWDGLPLVLYVEPFRFPVDYLVAKLIGGIKFNLPLPKL